MLSEALRLLRVFHEMKQGQLAQKLEISTSYVSEIENGNRSPSLEVIQKYSDLFKIPVSSIMFFSEQIDDAKTIKNTAQKSKKAIATKVISFLKTIEERAELEDA